jgi:spore coat polysaccharide biosynthesis protein SpsF (cytidylyltransferase family)
MLVTEEKVEEIINYLAESDDEYGRMAARVKGLEKDEKIITAQGLLEHRRYEKTMAESEAKARSSQQYREWREKYENAVADFEIMRSRRNTYQIIWETWRTEQANLRKS